MWWALDGFNGQMIHQRPRVYKCGHCADSRPLKLCCRWAGPLTVSVLPLGALISARVVATQSQICRQGNKAQGGRGLSKPGLSALRHVPAICPFRAVLLSEQPLFPDAIGEGILPDPQMERPFSSPALVATSKSGVQLFLDLSGLPRESVGSEYFMGSC